MYHYERIGYDHGKAAPAREPTAAKMRVNKIHSKLTNPKNQKTLSWLGAGIVAAAGGIWAVITAGTAVRR
jgi:hypothetical protein